MKHIIQVQVTKGNHYYVAEGMNLPIVTQAKTLDELVNNITEAVALALENENLADFDLAVPPSLLMSLELAAMAHT
ncbi:MAG: type II toxin-antitoxin system HicB family antitoxin [Patescibacteria group bacterium]